MECCIKPRLLGSTEKLSLWEQRQPENSFKLNRYYFFRRYKLKKLSNQKSGAESNE
jgi:hypothetical protein